jgi:hypothetical protein
MEVRVARSLLVDTGNSGWPQMKHSFVVRSGLDLEYSTGRATRVEAAGAQSVDDDRVCMRDLSIGKRWTIKPIPAEIGRVDQGLDG